MANVGLTEIINLLPDATFVIDKGGTVLYWNKAIEHMTGIPATDMVGKGNYEYSIPFYGVRRPALANTALSQQPLKPDNYNIYELRDSTLWAEIFVENMQGRPVWLRSAASVIHDETGLVVGAIETLFDISWRKRTEDTVIELNTALRELNASLEQRVNERTAALQAANADLIAASDAANAACRAKSEFLALMSHEIRTPMNAIIGFAEVASHDAGLSEKTAGHISIILNSAHGLLGIINDILDLSKLEGGHFEIEAIDFDVRDVIEESMRLLDGTALGKNLNLASEFSPDLPSMVTGDPYRLRQVIVNLVGNAIKFTENGGVTLSVRSGYKPDFLDFTVTDTGIGMTPDQIVKVFAPFTQADASMSRRFGGTGLGTSIAKKILELMEGDIWIESEYGKGSSFHFTAKLPFSANTTKDDIVPKPDSSANSAISSPHFRARRCDSWVRTRVEVAACP